MSACDLDGFTVLQQAVEQERHAVVEAIMEHCKTALEDAKAAAAKSGDTCDTGIAELSKALDDNKEQVRTLRIATSPSP